MDLVLLESFSKHFKPLPKGPPLDVVFQKNQNFKPIVQWKRLVPRLMIDKNNKTSIYLYYGTILSTLTINPPNFGFGTTQNISF